MSPFWKHAEEIFSTAREGGREDCEFSMLVGRDGSIYLRAGDDWGIEPLRVHHGAQAAFHVSRRNGAVRVEARSADESAVLLNRRAVDRMPLLLPDFPQYITL